MTCSTSAWLISLSRPSLPGASKPELSSRLSGKQSAISQLSSAARGIRASCSHSRCSIVKSPIVPSLRGNRERTRGRTPIARIPLIRKAKPRSSDHLTHEFLHVGMVDFAFKAIEGIELALVFFFFLFITQRKRARIGDFAKYRSTADQAILQSPSLPGIGTAHLYLLAARG